MEHDQLVRCLLAERAKVLGFTQAVMGRREGVEDVFQDACLLAIAKATEIKDETHLMAWIRLTCRNLCREVLRGKGPPVVALDDHVLSLLEDHWGRQEQKSSDIAQALRNCLGHLAEKSRDLIRRRYVDGMTVDEIARQVERPVKSVYVTFSRINAALADCIDRQLRVAK
jgi:RNA polymerase sigma factor (sigma-70 family)